MNEGTFASVSQLLERRVEQYRDKPFLFVESDGRAFTYTEFDREVDRAARLLASLGVGRGDRVSLYLTNSAEYDHARQFGRITSCAQPATRSTSDAG